MKCEVEPRGSLAQLFCKTHDCAMIGTSEYDMFCPIAKAEKETINHPPHYGGEDNPYEAILVIEAWGLDFCLGNVVKYIARHGKKETANELEDLKKARWYLNRRIQQLEKK